MFLQSSTLSLRGGLVIQKSKFSAYSTYSLRSRFHFQANQVFSCQWVVQKVQLRPKNWTSRLELRKCLLRIYAMRDFAGDSQELECASGMAEASSSVSEEEVVISSASDSEFVREASHSENSIKGRLVVPAKPTFRLARCLPGLLITAGLLLFITSLLFFVDWYTQQIIIPSQHSFFLAPSFLAAAIITGCLGCVCVPLLRKLKFEQMFREEGPMSHLVKMGTPTMGGLYFVPVGLVIASLLTRCAHIEVLGTLTVTLAFGAIGLLDDSLSLIRNHNYGLPGWLKFVLQVVAGTCFSFWWDSVNLPSPYEMKLLPLPAPIGPLYLGKWYLPLRVFCFAAMANGINLTDGLDGLAGGTAALTFIGMSIAVIPIYPGLSAFGASMAGACIGFLMHNRYKASIFMGDTGSMALGGALAAMASCSGMFLPLFIGSGVFVAETVSVILQVVYFKITKRLNGVGSRLFQMAPMHHHFELCGVKEPYIIASAYAISSVLSLFAAYVGLISA
ncbi:hypothetical protein SUGI_0066660 [Cryptomeria japonica]|uniref:phospho-N-acetylmuramoyl-pentapeptide- transferase homolog n=1 Tax=Cryptomeria japonica TaxID=3369 RepID=UPI002408A28B|nr:phospho-N-acetylmuramoyl-pentapeptide-transferase homolog [Cryptomeria japonica]GLJ07421.1 hypothetical protein SUGI_0066660 [Cryptomeria japonica]